MAKETAHQIGTPLSSLIGWKDYFKEKGIDSKILNEIEKDTDRLKQIANRFSKIIITTYTRISRLNRGFKKHY